MMFQTYFNKNNNEIHYPNSYIDKPNIKMVSLYVCQQSYVSTTKLEYIKLQLLMMENLQKLKKNESGTC